MAPIVFWIFVILMLGFGLSVIVSRNPVTSALSLVVSFIALAALYVSLGAFFIGVIQILVYAGAVMVLFLFIIMLLDLRVEIRKRMNLPAVSGGTIVIILFIKILFDVCYSFNGGHAEFPAVSVATHGDVWTIGTMIFRYYNLPLQIVGTLILVASIGVVILSKRELK
ncbi:MAG: NADH-quinone oxidoreductase subunit J [Verrucomicrobia bacterium]|nr:NADH-quinone oxidoreductase subunit J [Verrucomicrobiota bacterium]MBV9673778.1 NADH-quinone oxidoreductase subunit J [Verrucomicrobiota bacterium]